MSTFPWDVKSVARNLDQHYLQFSSTDNANFNILILSLCKGIYHIATKASKNLTFSPAFFNLHASFPAAAAAAANEITFLQQPKGKKKVTHTHTHIYIWERERERVSRTQVQETVVRRTSNFSKKQWTNKASLSFQVKFYNSNLLTIWSHISLNVYITRNH